MSVDLVGSTAFKGNPNYSTTDDGAYSPRWVTEFKNFYTEFPRILADKFTDNCKSFSITEVDEKTPRVWKTVGDEIIFCNRLFDVNHAACCIISLVRAMDSYRRQLSKNRIPLSLKATGWVAAFPAPNVTIEVVRAAAMATSAEEINEDERRERNADLRPHEFDFLGKGIDTGFRIAKHSSEERFSISVQLGYILAFVQLKRLAPLNISYHGRAELKGVVEGRPYPILSVDTEINLDMVELNAREAALGTPKHTNPIALRDFLETFMRIASIDMPYLKLSDGPLLEYPDSYIAYKDAYEKSLQLQANQLGSLEPNETNSSHEEGFDGLSESIEKFADITKDAANTLDSQIFHEPEDASQ